MQNIKQTFHTLSYLQYPLLLIGLFLIVKPIFKGFTYLSSNPEYLFTTYNYALIFFGVTLSFAALQDPNKTSFKYEKRIWKNPKKAKTILIFTIATAVVFFIAGLLGFILKENVIREFSYGSIILAIGLLGYLKLQMDIFENHRQVKGTAPAIENNSSTITQSNPLKLQNIKKENIETNSSSDTTSTTE